MADRYDTSPSTHVSQFDQLRAEGNGQAWREFEDRYRDMMLRFCRRRGLQPADAEDVVQSVFMSLFKSIPGFTYDPALGRFRDYLFRCVRNAISRWGQCPERAHARLLSHGGTGPGAGEPTSGDESAQWEAEWAASHYRRALARLRESCDARTVDLLERCLQNAAPDALAAEFGMSLEAVYKARQRGRQRLQEIVAEQVREEDELAR